MARAQLNYLVATSLGTTIQVVNLATVTVRKASDDTLATLYSASTGGATVANPLVADSGGRVAAWLDVGKYALVVDGSGVVTYTEYWDAVPAEIITSGGKGSVAHGTNAAMARPAGYYSIEWVGTVAPTNATSADTWVNTGISGGGGGIDPRVDLLEIEATKSNVFNTGSNSWPARPDGTVVLWIGGGATDDPSADMEDGDLWFPSET
jgi:hypothetical protein